MRMNSRRWCRHRDGVLMGGFWFGAHFYQKPPLEKPPGGTRPPLAACELSFPLPKPLSLDAIDFGSKSFGFVTTSCFVCSTKIFGSVVFMQKFKFDEFCWSYFGRGLFTFTSDSPKMFVWPPPGGFKTRLELRSSLLMPTLNDVEVIFIPLLSDLMRNTNKHPFWNEKKKKMPIYYDESVPRCRYATTTISSARHCAACEHIAWKIATHPNVIEL